MQRHTLKIWELSVLIGLSLCLLAGTWSEARLSSISARLVRLHVLAASDAPEEQAVKLRVRDAVLETLSPVLAGVGSAEEAETVLLDTLPAVRAAAERASGGRSVAVSLGPERYPTRDYGGFRLPAGRYRSLRVVLGEGKGHNWWCVVFPPVCLRGTGGGPAPGDEQRRLRPAHGHGGLGAALPRRRALGRADAQLAARGLLSD